MREKRKQIAGLGLSRSLFFTLVLLNLVLLLAAGVPVFAQQAQPGQGNNNQGNNNQQQPANTPILNRKTCFPPIPCVRTTYWDRTIRF